MKTLCDELSNIDLSNDLGLNLCVVPPTSHIVIILEDDLVRSYKERSEVCCY